MGAFTPVPLDPLRLTDATAVLSRAFLDDPPLRAIFPDDGERARLLPPFFRALLRAHLNDGEVWTTPGSVLGVALWLPPGRSPADASPAAADRRELERSWGAAAHARLGELMAHLDELHRRVIAGPHWYLAFIGVMPEQQGRGIAGQLFRPILERADAAGTPCYLETAVAGNLPFYERRGFRVRATSQMPGERDVPYWALRREPGGPR